MTPSAVGWCSSSALSAEYRLLQSSKRSTRSALAVATSLAGHAAHATEGYFALGHSPVQRALAGAGVARGSEAMSATINPAPSSQALPANPVVEGPGGPVPLTGFVFLQPDQIIIRKLPLGITSIQSFVLKADNVGGEGAFKTHVFLEPTIPKQTIEDDDDCN